MTAAADIADREAAVDPTNKTALMDIVGSRSILGDWLRTHAEPGAAHGPLP